MAKIKIMVVISLIKNRIYFDFNQQRLLRQQRQRQQLELFRVGARGQLRCGDFGANDSCHNDRNDDDDLGANDAKKCFVE